MNNYLHIAIGPSTKGSLKWFFKNNKEHKFYGEIRGFYDDLSMGSLYGIENNLDTRIDWIKKLYYETGQVEFFQEYTMDSELKESYISEMDISQNCKIIIWHGNNVVEQTALRYLVNRFKNNEIYEVSIPSYIKRDKLEIYLKSTGECSPEELGAAIENISLINTWRKDNLISEWNEMINEKATLRIIEDNKIIPVSDDYYDKEILKYTPKDFIKAVRVVGMVLGMSNQVVGDLFINYRLRKLIELGKIEYSGKLKMMRDFNVRLRS
ncbi:DUF3658 domain-containing protein [Anaerovorax odorimutans]|uniref:DUF3658 domain-containing protein n=1 Tax=Anaerovorax odorimutans TaxID=109327 RepID=UPI000429826D|nr:DUF3658 domain-containing protein [Anaerovorax odorimutans]